MLSKVNEVPSIIQVPEIIVTGTLKHVIDFRIREAECQQSFFGLKDKVRDMSGSGKRKHSMNIGRICIFVKTLPADPDHSLQLRRNQHGSTAGLSGMRMAECSLENKKWTKCT